MRPASAVGATADPTRPTGVRVFVQPATTAALHQVVLLSVRSSHVERLLGGSKTGESRPRTWSVPDGSTALLSVPATDGRHRTSGRSRLPRRSLGRTQRRGSRTANVPASPVANTVSISPGPASLWRTAAATFVRSTGPLTFQSFCPCAAELPVHGGPLGIVLNGERSELLGHTDGPTVPT